ncbi:hypothetical protein, conserved [Leishmania tarentolae]|uniref:Uncharacterized protein n=1 Tax=Leishmania tarentolae TaxID=5689 RepID=A0A640KKH9_LEITA|nr:hypothetical protein, conserved [Leishmania tarentolae]
MHRSSSSQLGATKEPMTGSSSATTQRAGSSLHARPVVLPEEANIIGTNLTKSVTTSREQMLYLQALYPYAPYDELMTVISNTNGADEAAEHAYEVLNPDYNSFAYLKEQHDLCTNEKLSSVERAAAFSDLRESLQERAASVFRPGHFGNLSQLQEYQETVGLFIVDTSDWDRATRLSSHDVAEMTFMDLPLLEESTNYGAASTSCNSDSDGVNELRRDEGSQGQRTLLAASSNATRFLNVQRGSKQDPVSNTVSASLSGKNTEKGSSAPTCGASKERLIGGLNGNGALDHQEGSTTASVVYVGHNDPPRAAPIIAWAPEAIRVGPVEARRECEDILRVFDEAAFFKNPLVQLATSPPPSNGNSAHAHISPLESTLAVPSAAEGGEAHGHLMNGVAGASARTLAAAPSPHTTFPSLTGKENEVHEPFDPGSRSLSNLGNGDSFNEKAEALLSAQAPPTSSSHPCSRTCLPEPYAAAQPFSTPSTSTAYCLTKGTRHISDNDDNSTSSSARCVELRKRDETRKALKGRKPHALTTSETVFQRMRSRTPIGNLIFREASQQTPLLSPRHKKSGNGLLNVACSPEQALSHVTTAHEEANARNGTAEGTERQQVSRNGCDDIAANGRDMTGGGTGERDSKGPFNTRTLAIPAAHSRCSSLDPIVFLNAEEERWDTIATMLAPYEEVFGSRSRCQLVRCVYDECPKLRANITVILQRLLHVVGKALRGKELGEGMTEELLKVPLLGSILLSTSPIKLTELTFCEDKCSFEFCEEGTWLQAKLSLKAIELDAIQFAYIGEVDAARQARAKWKSQRQKPGSSWRAGSSTRRSSEQEEYTTGATRGTAKIKASNVRLKGRVYIWLMASGKMHVAFQKTTVSIGSFQVSTTVTKLNVLCTLGAPFLRLMIQRGIKQVLQSGHSL